MYKFLIAAFLNLIALSALASSSAQNQCVANIENHSSSGVLFFDDCDLHDSDMMDVVHFLAAHPKIDTVRLKNNHLSDEGVKILATIPNVLTLISIEHNQIKEEGAIALTKFSMLQDLYMNNNAIGDKGAVMISKKLNNLSYFDASSNNIGDEGVIALAKLPKLRYLNLNNNKISDIGVAAISNNKKIFKLGLSHNKITDLGAKSIATMPRMVFLSLADNQISDVGAIALQDLKLLDLDLANNKITPAGVRPLLEGHGHYFYIGLNDNHLGDEGAALFASVTNTTFTIVNLSNSQITDKGAIVLAQSSLDKLLYLAHNEIRDDGAIALSRSKLKGLDVSYNHIGHAGIEALENSHIDVDTEGNDGVPGLKSDSVQAIPKFKKCTADLEKNFSASQDCMLDYKKSVRMAKN